MVGLVTREFPELEIDDFKAAIFYANSLVT
jgi:hypothetical protein